MSAAVHASKTQKHIQKVLNRAIVIVVNDHTQSVSLYMESDIVHSIEEAQKLCNFFSANKRTKSEKFEQYKKRIFKKLQVHTF